MTTVTKIDPAVQRAVLSSKIKRRCYLKYLVKALFFHAYFATSLAILLPLFIFRSIVPGFGKWKSWTFLQALGVQLVRHALNSMIRFRMQPLAPREKGLRESTGPLGQFLELLNLSGPGGNAAGMGMFARPDMEWFPPPPLEAFQGFFSINVTGKTRVESPYYSGPALLEPKWANVRTRAFWFMQNGRAAPVKGPLGSQKRPVIVYIRACDTYQTAVQVSLSAPAIPSLVTPL